MSGEMKTTTLSLEPPSLTYDSPAMSEPPVATPQHALVLKLEETISYERTITIDSRAYSLFLHRLRSIVQHDGEDSPRIDMVRMIGPLPDERTYKVLEGLRPRHFEVGSGPLDEHELGRLELLSWPLESFTIVDVINESAHLPSKFVQYIPSLTLRDCCGLSFLPATDRSPLRHLTIIEYNTLDMFTDLMEKFSVADQLETLKLHRGNDDVWYPYKIDFMNTLRRCTSLHSLDLSLSFIETWRDDDSEFNTSFTDLPQYFPDNIEYLRFRGPPEIGKDLSMWLQFAAEPSWLPNLKTLSFEIEVDESSTPDTNAHVEQFLGTLLQSHPAVQIIP